MRLESLSIALTLVMVRAAVADPADEALATAPHADQASGIAVQSPESDHAVLNGVLVVPRTLALILLAGPRLAAAELDEYLEGKSPDAFGRTAKHSGWRAGVVADWETNLGPSVGLRVGRSFAQAVAVDAYGGFFGARGQSGGLRAQLGKYTDLELQPSVTFDAGRQLARVYSGIDMRGPRTHYLERRLEAQGALGSRLGLFRISASAGVSRVATYDEDSDDDPVAAGYDPMAITGFAETQRAATGEISIAYDDRRRSHSFIHKGAWSTGWLVRAVGSYSRGDASPTGSFSTGRGTLEAHRLFDLFHGDRVLSIGARTEAITADADAVPFELLPALGGADRLRAFARDELRGRSATFADIQYEWALGADTRAFLFVEAGGVAPRPTALERQDLHVGYGGGLRLLNGSATSLRAQLAGSDDGDLGFFLQLGGSVMNARFAMILVAAVGCGGSGHNAPGTLRFQNQDPVTLVNDRAPLPAPPTTFDQGLVEYYVHQDLIEPTRRALTIEDRRRARNVNSLGEVPDSTWFENRKLTPEQLRKGPGLGGPDRSEPWRVVGVKVGGAAIGITFEDARKDRYVLKFDEHNFPETESAADVIVQRLAWAFGYNVPDNQVVTFKREQLTLDPTAEVKNRQGGKRPMTQADLDQYLGFTDSENGTYRALASKMISGKIIGGVEPEGTRKGDPNDRVPHELRRDLRGQRVLWAWVNHPDLKSQNSLASLEPEGYVKWYTLDFGESLGVGGRTTATPRLGYRTTYGMRDSLLSLVTFGAYVHPWERTAPRPQLRGLGDFESEQFDPATWAPNHNWRPTDMADKHDQFWATEILLRLTPAHIQAAVEAGQYTDPRTTAYVVQTLIERQRKIGQWALSRVAPLTDVTARTSPDGLTVCFEDLWLAHGYGAADATRYEVASFDYAGEPLGARRTITAAAPKACATGLRAGTSHEGYTIVQLRVTRDGAGDPPPMFVHIAAGPGGPRVIGLDRR